jgi:hypothetical protein
VLTRTSLLLFYKKSTIHRTDTAFVTKRPASAEIEKKESIINLRESSVIPGLIELISRTLPPVDPFHYHLWLIVLLVITMNRYA